MLLAPPSHTQVDLVRAKLHSGPPSPALPAFHVQPDYYRFSVAEPVFCLPTVVLHITIMVITKTYLNSIL